MCGDVAIPERVDALRVTILDAQRDEIVAGVRELVLCPQDELRPLPQTFTFEPLDVPDAWVVVQGLEGDVTRVRFERRVSLSSDRREVVRLGVTRACLGVMCPLGQTCVQGICERVGLGEPEGMCGEADASPDPTPEMGPPAPAEDMGGGVGDMGQGPPGPRYCPPEDDLGGVF